MSKHNTAKNQVHGSNGRQTRHIDIQFSLSLIA